MCRSGDNVLGESVWGDLEECWCSCSQVSRFEKLKSKKEYKSNLNPYYYVFFLSGVHNYNIREKVGGGRLFGLPPGPDHQKRGSLASSGWSISQDREQLKKPQSYNIFEVYAIGESSKSIFLLEGLFSTCHEFSSQRRSSGLPIDFVHVDLIGSSTLDIVWPSWPCIV